MSQTTREATSLILKHFGWAVGQPRPWITVSLNAIGFNRSKEGDHLQIAATLAANGSVGDYVGVSIFDLDTAVYPCGGVEVVLGNARLLSSKEKTIVCRKTKEGYALLPALRRIALEYNHLERGRLICLEQGMNRRKIEEGYQKLTAPLKAEDWRTAGESYAGQSFQRKQMSLSVTRHENDRSGRDVTAEIGITLRLPEGQAVAFLESLNGLSYFKGEGK